MKNLRFLYRHPVAILAGCLIIYSAAQAVTHDPESFPPASEGEAHSSQAVGFIPQRVIVKFRADIPAPVVELLTTALDTQVEGGIPELGVLFLKLPPYVREQHYLELFRDFLPVQYAELDYIVPPAAQSRTIMPNDPWFDISHEYGWHLTRIGAPAAWYYQRGNPRVVVALIDTGVNLVPDLVGKIVLGWNFYNQNIDTSDVTGHGTSVAGVLAAATNNGLGVAGVAWNCRIMPVRIASPEGNGSYGVAAQAIIWAANRGARVVNLSWAMGQSELVRDAARYFMEQARGVVVIPAGNSGLPAAGNPPDNPYLLRVSAIAKDGLRAPFSDYGTDIDLCAPGDYIPTTTRTGSYTLAGGTSFAAPIVAGVAALALSANPYLSGEQLQQILKASAVDIGPTGWDWEYGWGCVNAYRAVMMARGLPPESGSPVVRITSHGNEAVVNGAFWVACNASDYSGISHVEFYVDNALIGRRLSPPYQVWWNSMTVTPGYHTLSAVAYDGAGNRGVHSVRIYVNNPEDRLPPTVTITSINGQTPVDGMVLQGDGLVVEVDARDDVGVVLAELYVDGVRRVSTAVSPFTLRWSTRTLASGEHLLQVRVYDGAGRRGDSQVVRVVKP